MSRLRIRCKGEEFKPGALSGVIPSFFDLVVEYLGDDGKVSELTNVQSVRFEVEASTEPARAVVTFVNVELDAEIAVDTQAGLEIERAAGLRPEEDGAPWRCLVAEGIFRDDNEPVGIVEIGDIDDLAWRFAVFACRADEHGPASVTLELQSRPLAIERSGGRHG